MTDPDIERAHSFSIKHILRAVMGVGVPVAVACQVESCILPQKREWYRNLVLHTLLVLFSLARKSLQAQRDD